MHQDSNRYMNKGVAHGVYNVIYISCPEPYRLNWWIFKWCAHIAQTLSYQDLLSSNLTRHYVPCWRDFSFVLRLHPYSAYFSLSILNSVKDDKPFVLLLDMAELISGSVQLCLHALNANYCLHQVLVKISIFLLQRPEIQMDHGWCSHSMNHHQRHLLCWYFSYI